MPSSQRVLALAALTLTGGRPPRVRRAPVSPEPPSIDLGAVSAAAPHHNSSTRGQIKVSLPTGDVVRELVAARTQLRRYGTLLNQAVAKLNATGEVDLALGAALERCEASTAAVRAAVERLGRAGAGQR